jgi:probable HAF family extracellular repeat protein
MHVREIHGVRRLLLTAILVAGCTPEESNAPLAAPGQAAGSVSSHLVTPTPIDLGTLGGPLQQSAATGINDATQVVGWSETASGVIDAFLWQGGAMQDLGTPNGQNTYATAISDVGRIVGYTDGFGGVQQPWVLTNGQYVYLPLPGGKSGRATALGPGSGGVIAGCMFTPSQPSSYEIVKWTPTAPPALYTRTSLGVAGTSACASGIDALQRVSTSIWRVWRAGQFRSLGFPREVRGMDPTGTGRMTGNNPSGDWATYWPNVDLSPPIIFGVSACVPLRGHPPAFGNAVNALGQIAGHGNCLSTSDPLAPGCAFLWATEAEWELLPPLVPDAGGCCSVASALNLTDQVVGASTVAPGLNHATLWGVIPVVTVLQLPPCSPRPCRIPAKVSYIPKKFINDGILSRPGFDATLLDPNFVTLGDGFGRVTAIARTASGGPMASITDVDGDGVLDLSVSFSKAQLIADGVLTPTTYNLEVSAIEPTGLPWKGHYPIWVQ